MAPRDHAALSMGPTLTHQEVQHDRFVAHGTHSSHTVSHTTTLPRRT